MDGELVPTNSGEQVCITCCGLCTCACCCIAPLSGVAKLCGMLHERCNRKSEGPKYGGDENMDDEAQRETEESQKEKQSWKNILTATSEPGGAVLLRTPYPVQRLHPGSAVRVRGVAGLEAGATLTVSRVLDVTQFELRATPVDEEIGEVLGPHLALAPRAAFRVLAEAPLTTILRKLGFGAKSKEHHAPKRRRRMRRPPGFVVVKVGERRSSRDAKHGTRVVVPTG